MLIRYTLMTLAMALVAMPITALHAAPADQPEVDARQPQSVLEARGEQVLNNAAAQIFFLMQERNGVEPQDIFSTPFLNAVPAARLRAMFEEIQARYGPVQSVLAVERTGDYRARISYRFEKAIGSGDLVLNPAAPHRVEGLLLNEFEVIGDQIEAIRAELEALPGEVGVYFGSLDGTKPRIEINADRQFAIASAAKLYVLSALTREMEAENERYWNDVVFVGEACLVPRCERTGRSFPSGITQNWPTPMPLTVQSLATLMISQSDNTATDALIEYLSEERVVKEMIDSGHSAPELNQPFLTTRQMFGLKASGSDAHKAYRSAEVDAKYEMAWEAAQEELVQEDIDAAFANGPTALDIEWFASPHDLRRLLAYLPRDQFDIARQILAINPSAGPLAARNYSPILYKGGSEPGVLNYTWLLRSVYGWEVLTMTWNNSEATLDEARFHFLAERLLALPPQADAPP